MYNENGLRVQKTVNGVVTKYTLYGKDIKHMTKGSDELHFFYDASNKPAVVVYNGAAYSYVKNLQGDIVAILNSAGTAVVNYVYDAWGRPISKTGNMAGTLGTVQPFRYRAYVYDEETGLYYLNTRYYDTCRSRFINSDSVMKLSLCSNLFSYCLNTPVCRTDALGTESIAADAWLFIQQNGLKIAMADNYLPLGEMVLFAMVGGTAILAIGEWAVNSVVNLYESLTAASSVTVVALSAQIDWGKADKNHVLNGSKTHGRHDWSMFGIDPNDPNAWEKLLPILKTVVDQGREYLREPASGNAGGELVRYIYRFSKEAVEVVVKLFISPDGSIRLSDAWPLTQ